ncbi:NAD(P)/FAD-dependent oxidoreductase [Streptomyces sp. NPDC018031]|uniref:NAD(P)/FAD-dependent oxidoreductase n=1 Tax=Streptomyces sp. NPDC018031 TaxID=3365033 RepID=UPI0037B82C66
MRVTGEPDDCHRVVVIGGGMAGARLAQQLARVPEVALTVVGEEPHPPYNRVLLAEVLAGRYAPEVIALPAAPADRLSGVRAVRVDRDRRVVRVDDGRVVPYDTLVLATGSNPVLPPLRGLFRPDGGAPEAPGGGRELPAGVHAFRTMDDCLALGAAVRPGSRAVVIGGGLLGVSAARALAQRGAQVVLAHQGEHLMERQLDSGAARLLHDHMSALGVEVHTECRVRGLRTGPPGRDGEAAAADAGAAPPAGTDPAGAGRPPVAVRAVELADGYALDADLVVLACGVRPRVGLARAAGITTARGVVVDDELRTSDPDVYAIGDCAEHDGVLYGLAGPAQEQADLLARVIAARVAGPPAAAGPAGAGRPRYTGTRALTRLTLAGPGPAPGADAAAPTAPGVLDLAAFGDPTPGPGDDVVRLSDATRNAYRKVVVRGDRLVGGILFGDLGTVGALARTWEGDEPLPSAPLLHLLTNDGGPR